MSYYVFADAKALQRLWLFILFSLCALALSACDDGKGSNGISTSNVSAQDDSISVNSLLGLFNVNALTNDTFSSGGRISSVTTPSNGGVATINQNQTSIDYVPVFNTTGSETFDYVLTDDSGNSSTATVTATLSTNTPPVTLPDTYSVLTDSSNNQLDVLLNDTDINNDPLTITAASVALSVPPTSGETLIIDTLNNVLTYSPPAGYVGLQTITYTADDGQGGSMVGVAAVTASPLSTPPVAIPDLFNLQSNSPATSFNVLANDIDLSGSGLSLQTVALQSAVPPSNGSTVSISNNQLLYAPGTDYQGVETISYEVTNGNGHSAQGLATIITSPLTVPPVALPDVTSVEPDSAANLIDSLANDVDLSGTGLTIDSVSSVVTVPVSAGGAVSTDGNNISYTPAPGFVGVETLSYTISDGNGGTNTAVITATVLGLPVALPPIAVVDLSNVNSDSSNNSIDVLSNDIDPANGGLTITNVSSVTTVPLGATSTISTDGNTLTYTPAAGFIGIETLSYTITDDNGATAMGAVNVIVAAIPSNLPPVAVPDVATVATDSGATAITALSNDVDTTSTGLSITATSIATTVPAGTPGSVSTDGSTLNYTPATGFSGVETLNYTITDGNGTSSSSIVSVVVTPLPLPPVAVPDLAAVLAESSNNSITVLTNDADISSTGLTITNVSSSVTLPAGSTGTVSTDGSTVTYSPEAGFVGVEVLDYEITDGNGNTSTSIVTVTVSALAAPPVAIADVASVNQDSSNNALTVLTNDIDLAGGGLTVNSATSLTTIPSGSTGTASTDGTTVTYTPEAGFSGVELVQYEIADNNGNTATGLITVTVVPTPTVLGPIAVPDAVNVSEDSSNNLITVIANDIDPAAGGLTLTAASFSTDFPSDGNHTVTTNGNQIDFTPTAGYVGLVTLAYTVEDSNSNTANGTAVVTVTSLPIEVPPLALPDIGSMGASATASFDVIANDVDPAAGGLTVTSANIVLELPLSGGSNSVAIVGNQVEVTTGIYIGVITIQYEITDSNGNTSTATLVVTVL